MIQSMQGLDTASYTNKDSMKNDFLALKCKRLRRTSCYFLEASDWCPLDRPGRPRIFTVL